MSILFLAFMAVAALGGLLVGVLAVPLVLMAVVGWAIYRGARRVPSTPA